jgi:sialic acid synthase SpsE
LKRLIIAEIGGNHNGSMEEARDLIHAAKDVGCDIAKFQLYKTELIKNPGDANYDYLKSVELTRDDMLFLAEECELAGIEFCASVFDIERLKWLDCVPIERYKIASRSINDVELLSAVEAKEKPVIASLQKGFWNNKDLPVYDFDYLYCISRTQIIKGMPIELPNKFNKYAGFSDHTIGIEWALKALSQGAKIIEKHFTFNLNYPGWDQPGSATPAMMSEIVKYARYLE